MTSIQAVYVPADDFTDPAAVDPGLVAYGKPPQELSYRNLTGGGSAAPVLYARWWRSLVLRIAGGPSHWSPNRRSAVVEGSSTMLRYQLLRSEGVLILTPESPLEVADFEKLAQEIDPYIEANGKLHGVMIDAKSFPGWKDFSGLVAHLKFVRNHHQKIEKLAVVSDSSILTFAPRLPVISFRLRSSTSLSRRRRGSRVAHRREPLAAVGKGRMTGKWARSGSCRR